MKKRMKMVLTVMTVLISIVFSVVVNISTVEAKSKNCQYMVYAGYISKFTLNNGKLTVKVTPKNSISSTYIMKYKDDKYKTKKITLKVAKKCKWVEETQYKYKPDIERKKTSYKKVKASIKADRKNCIRNGYYENDAPLRIYVKNNKVVKVVYAWL